jgi:hypothetical protein
MGLTASPAVKCVPYVTYGFILTSFSAAVKTLTLRGVVIVD